MLSDNHTIPERRARSHQEIDDLVECRTGALALYSELASKQPFKPEQDTQRLLQTFCESLIDYTASAHFSCTATLMKTVSVGNLSVPLPMKFIRTFLKLLSKFLILTINTIVKITVATLATSQLTCHNLAKNWRTVLNLRIA